MDFSAPSNEPTCPRWQFGIRGLLILVFCCALGCAYWRWLRYDWFSATTSTRVVISILIVIGLVTQAFGIFRRLGAEKLSTDARFGLWFAMGWRCAIALLFLGFHIVEQIDAAFFLDEESLFFGWQIGILYHLALIVVLASIRQPCKQRRPLKAWYLRYGVLWILGGIYCSYILHDHLHLTYIVFRAIPNPSVIRRVEPAYWLGIGSAALIPFNISFIYLAAQCSKSSWRLLWQVLFVGAFCAMTGMFLWNYMVALPAAAPIMIEQRFSSGAWHFWLIAAPCLLVLITAAAYRWTAVASAAPLNATPAPAERETVYLHERWLLVASLAAVMLIEIVYGVISLLVDFGWEDVYLFVEMLFFYGSYPASVAACILVMQKCLTGLRRGPLPPLAPAELPLKNFLAVWLAVAATMLVAIPVLTSYGFALWLSSWI